MVSASIFVITICLSAMILTAGMALFEHVDGRRKVKKREAERYKNVADVVARKLKVAPEGSFWIVERVVSDTGDSMSIELNSGINKYGPKLISLEKDALASKWFALDYLAAEVDRIKEALLDEVKRDSQPTWDGVYGTD